MKIRLFQVCLITLVTIFSLLSLAFLLTGIEFMLAIGNGGISAVSGGSSSRWINFMLRLAGAIIVAAIIILAVMRKKRRD